jgi:hypothetical protein
MAMSDRSPSSCNELGPRIRGFVKESIALYFDAVLHPSRGTLLCLFLFVSAMAATGSYQLGARVEERKQLIALIQTDVKRLDERTKALNDFVLEKKFEPSMEFEVGVQYRSIQESAKALSDDVKRRGPFGRRISVLKPYVEYIVQLTSDTGESADMLTPQGQEKLKQVREVTAALQQELKDPRVH